MRAVLSSPVQKVVQNGSAWRRVVRLQASDLNAVGSTKLRGTGTVRGGHGSIAAKAIKWDANWRATQQLHPQQNAQRYKDKWCFSHTLPDKRPPQWLGVQKARSNSILSRMQQRYKDKWYFSHTLPDKWPQQWLGVQRNKWNCSHTPPDNGHSMADNSTPFRGLVASLDWNSCTMHTPCQAANGPAQRDTTCNTTAAAADDTAAAAGKAQACAHLRSLSQPHFTSAPCTAVPLTKQPLNQASASESNAAGGSPGLVYRPAGHAPPHAAYAQRNHPPDLYVHPLQDVHTPS